MTRIGSLFSGYGGLDMAVQSVLGGTLAWYSEINKHACTVLAAHHPGVPNLGDITTGDWATVPPVDILTGGYPCQPFSHAGQRKGTNDERHLWPYVRDAVGALEPRLVVLENVRGHLSMGLADVIGDLAALGYDARWGVVRASDAGAAHGRARVFIVASPADADCDGFGGLHATGGAGEQRGGLRPGTAGHPVPATDAADLGHERGGHARRGGDGSADGSGVDWGRYAAAINRWQRVIGRPAPAPMVPGSQGKPRLSPVFVEWLMGLDEGHVTGHGLPRTAQLRMLGNGVVPQQAELALRMLLADEVAHTPHEPECVLHDVSPTSYDYDTRCYYECICNALRAAYRRGYNAHATAAQEWRDTHGAYQQHGAGENP